VLGAKHANAESQRPYLNNKLLIDELNPTPFASVINSRTGRLARLSLDHALLQLVQMSRRHPRCTLLLLLFLFTVTALLLLIWDYDSSGGDGR
jgi:hypothetical protein